ncbi:MAG TPA: prepilin-type N-terminal cleavage/methylation domain-containing protein [Thermoanaerobaculia bacterium]|nr:prepilin-type N-terminal cleavage/methylation domain-containing protein [Thermoanaerobaculia bacterium]
MNKRRAAQRGMTLIETLVAVAIFAIVFLAALSLYTSANKAYLQTDAAAVQQQNVRFAMDRMMQTVHDAGAGYNALGSSKLADEQIEGAWDAAMFTRGDFDNERENTGTSLESTTFPIITTGNDEIVGFVLLKNGTGSIPISIKADFSAPRDALYTAQNNITNEETKTINVAAATLADQTNPPYQLARVTWNSAGVVQTEILAENIYRMKFEYYGATGNSTIMGGATGTGSGDNERDERAAVRRIRVRLIGMADRPDFGYVDPWLYGANFSDMQSTVGRNYRKFALEETVLSPNLGIKGRKHKATPALSLNAPTGITVCTGHSLYFYVRWNASTSLGVNEYSLKVTAPAVGTTLAAFTEELPILGGTLYKEYKLPGLNETDGQRAYTFSVAASTSGVNGTYGPTATLSSAHVDPASTPQVPGGVNVTGSNNPSVMNLSWTQVTQSTGTLSGNCISQGTGVTTGQDSTWATAVPDLKEYRVYRVRRNEPESQNFDPYAAGRRVDNLGTNLTPTAPAGSFTDTMASPCEPYYYKVEAVDNGGLKNVAGNGFGPVSIPDPGEDPAPPGGANAANAVTGFYTTPAGNDYSVNIAWPAVTLTASGARARATHYLVTREKKKVGDTSWSPDTTFDVYDATSYADTPSQKTSGTTTFYRYYVQAKYTECSRLSSRAGPYEMISCNSSATMTVVKPAAGDEISTPFESGFTPRATVTTVAGQTINSVTAIITGPDGENNVIYSDVQTPATTVVGANSITFAAWNGAASVELGVYTFSTYAVVNNCKTATQTRSFVLGYATCSLQIVDNSLTLSPNGNPKNYRLSFRIQNTCDPLQGGIDFVTTGMSLTFTGYGGSRTVQEIRLDDPSTGTLVTASPIPGSPGSGVAFAFTTNQTINAGTTTGTWYVIFSDEMKSGSNTTTFSGIVVNTTTPANANDQILAGTVTP